MDESGIFYRDSDLIVCRKEAGMLSEASDRPGADSLPLLLSAFLREAGERPEVYPVHRLDRRTGGLLVCARTPAAAAVLSAAFSEGRVKKQYLAVAEGICEPVGRLTDLLYYDRQKDKSYVVRRMRRGVREARLTYDCLRCLYGTDTCGAQTPPLSLLRVRPETGRTHQIRVQFASRQHPLAGDARYGARTRGALALFCCALILPHPADDRLLRFVAPPPQEGFFSRFSITAQDCGFAPGAELSET